MIKNAKVKMKTELGKKEVIFILKTIEQYWDVWFDSHEDNLVDANVSKSLKEKLEKLLED